MKALKFKEPQSPAEEFELFTLIEDRGERVLVSCVQLDNDPYWVLKPTFVYLKKDLEEVTL